MGRGSVLADRSGRKTRRRSQAHLRQVFDHPKTVHDVDRAERVQGLDVLAEVLDVSRLLRRRTSQQGRERRAEAREQDGADAELLERYMRMSDSLEP